MLSYVQAWEVLLARLDMSRPANLVTAARIKALGKEPRLMTKCDARASRYSPLKDRGLFILPATNSAYHIIREDGYCDLDYRRDDPATHFSARFPFDLETLENTGSEMGHLVRLFLAGVIEDFVGHGPLLATIRGRRFSPEFEYRVGTIGLRSSGVQFEVDQGYESAEEIVLFEAKTTTPKDFIIRQLYFPYRIFSQTYRKRVRAVFMNFDAERGLYSLFEFGFADPMQYRSIVLLQHRNYVLDVPRPDLRRSLGDFLTAELPSGGWDVPQADDVYKIMRLPLLVAEGYADSATMATAFDFAPRQSSYYQQACEQLGLVSRAKNRYHLTDRGNEFLALPQLGRVRWMVSAICSSQIVRACIATALGRDDGCLRRSDIEILIARHCGISGETVRRRAKTVKAWLRWLQQALGELCVDGKVLTLETEMKEPARSGLLREGPI